MGCLKDHFKEKKKKTHIKLAKKLLKKYRIFIRPKAKDLAESDQGLELPVCFYEPQKPSLIGFSFLIYN